MSRAANSGWLRKTLVAAGLAVALFAPVHAVAQYYKYEKYEVAPLPRYCYVRLERFPSDEWLHWEKVLGPTSLHVHHYCRGLIFSNRVLFNSAKKHQREELLRQSLQEFDYVITRSRRDFVLLPEILTKKGENALKLSDKYSEGLTALTDAIQLKPDYWPPYAALSDHYKRIGDTRQARQLLEKALSFAPETQALKTRLAALDGKSVAPPAPQPAKPKPPAEKSAPDEVAQPADGK